MEQAEPRPRYSVRDEGAEVHAWAQSNLGGYVLVRRRGLRTERERTQAWLREQMEQSDGGAGT